MRAVLVSICLASVAMPAAAHERKVVSRAADIDPVALAPLLARGELALVESDASGRSRQVVVFAAIAASPAKVYDAIMNVDAYPEYMRSVVSAKTVRRKGSSFAFDWELNVPILNLKGRRAVRGLRPSKIEMIGVSGHFRDSHERWELTPLDGGKRTLAVLYRTLDIRTAGLLLRTMVDLEPSMDHGINAAAGFVNIRDLARHCEGLPLAVPGRHTGPIPAFVPVLADKPQLEALSGLMNHGELALIESHPDGSLRQVTVLTVVNASAKQLMAVAHAPKTWPDFVPNLVKQDVFEEGKGKLRLEYEIDVPLMNIEGINRMTIHENGEIDMYAVSGDVSRGQWRWEFKALDDKRTVPIHYAYTDVRSASWFVNKLVESQPLFEHGAVVTATTIAVRALKARAEGDR